MMPSAFLPRGAAFLLLAVTLIEPPRVAFAEAEWSARYQPTKLEWLIVQLNAERETCEPTLTCFPKRYNTGIAAPLEVTVFASRGARHTAVQTDIAVTLDDIAYRARALGIASVAVRILVVGGDSGLELLVDQTCQVGGMTPEQDPVARWKLLEQTCKLRWRNPR